MAKLYVILWGWPRFGLRRQTPAFKQSWLSPTELTWLIVKSWLTTFHRLIYGNKLTLRTHAFQRLMSRKEVGFFPVTFRELWNCHIFCTSMSHPPAHLFPSLKVLESYTTGRLSTSQYSTVYFTSRSNWLPENKSVALYFVRENTHWFCCLHKWASFHSTGYILWSLISVLKL